MSEAKRRLVAAEHAGVSEQAVDGPKPPPRARKRRRGFLRGKYPEPTERLYFQLSISMFCIADMLTDAGKHLEAVYERDDPEDMQESVASIIEIMGCLVADAHEFGLVLPRVPSRSSKVSPTARQRADDAATVWYTGAVGNARANDIAAKLG